MKKINLVLLLVVFAFTTQIASTQPASSASSTTDEIAAKDLAAYKKWRENIPDYEKRLYDRVKKMNTRAVRIQGTMIIGFVLLLILNAASLFFLFVKKSSPGPTPIIARRSYAAISEKTALPKDLESGMGEILQDIAFNQDVILQKTELLHGVTNTASTILAQISRDIDRIQETSKLVDEKITTQGPALPLFVNLIRKLVLGRIVDTADRRRIKKLLRRQTVLLNAISDLHQLLNNPAGENDAVNKLVIKIESELEEEQKKLS